MYGSVPYLMGAGAGWAGMGEGVAAEAGKAVGVTQGWAELVPGWAQAREGAAGVAGRGWAGAVG